jgi:hypothetical protein
VTALDLFNNTATGYTGTVHFSSTDASAGLPADGTLSGGTGSFSATLKTAGGQTITTTDLANSSVTGTSGTVAVSAAAATHFAVSAPATATAGSAFSLTVTALDPFNNTAAGYAGTVHFTSTDARAALPANGTLSGGTASFSATLKTAGGQTITATDAVNAAVTGASGSIAVSAAAATHFAVTVPATATAGAAFSLTVTALDPFNNTATGYAGTVHFSSSDASASLPADGTLSGGTGSFSATLKTAGSQTVTATDTANASLTGTSGTVAVRSAAATHFSLSAPATATAGAAFGATVTVLDLFNNAVTGYGGTVHFTSGDAQAVLPADYTFTGADKGVHTFAGGVALKTAGNQTVTATDTLTSSLSGTSNGVAVSAAAATHFTVGGPATATAGAAFGVTVTALDPFNNTAAGYRGTVHFTSRDAQAGLPADYTFTAGDNGTHPPANGVTLKTAGSQTVTATDTANPSLTGTSGSITVGAAAANHFTVSGPATATAGAAFGFTVTALDPFNNTATGYTGTVDFSSTDASASLPAIGTLSGGTGSFSATLKTAGGQTVTATAAANASLSGTSGPVAVSAAAASTLAVGGYPATVTAGTAFRVTVTTQDAYNNIVTGYTGTVHFTSSDDQAMLPPAYSFTAADGGVHTFLLTLNTAGPQSLTVADTDGHAYVLAGITVSPPPAPPSARSIVARLVTVKARRKKRLMVEVLFADTGALKGEFTSPFRRPRYTRIQAGVRDSDGDGVPDQVVLTARKGKRAVTAIFPG